MLHALAPLLPEIWLLTAACVVLLAATAKRDAASLAYHLAIGALAINALLVVAVRPTASSTHFFGQFQADPVAALIKLAATLMFLLLLSHARDYLRVRRALTGEYFAIALMALLGIMVLASAASLLTVYLGLELLSLSLYSLVAMHRDSPTAPEAAIKYFILGALASGMLLYGMSIIYGLTGTLDLARMAEVVTVAEGPNTPLFVFGVVFIVVGIAFKLGIVPFHMWIPDVYHGAPTCVTMLIGSAPKLAGFALGYRLLADGLPELAPHWAGMLVLLGTASVVFGNTVALAQTSLKRLLGYSTIAHMGFLALGLASATQPGFAAALHYAVVYGVVSLAAFGVLIWMGSDGRDADDLTELRGIATRSPLIGALLVVIVFSLAGVPPFVGFWAKWFVLKELVAAEHVTAAVVAVIFSVVAAYYYLRLLKLAFFESPDSRTPVPEAGRVPALVSLNGLLLVLMGLFPSALLTACLTAVRA
ncbi:MAG TPA: NADH-quinone oxidoreductase subunit NuoN [Gammaproteobacteria bacterium]|nr:NADH-quinone oxidoreductase subunit NuoN [Gammaproteobacteria bacterium]